MMLMIEQGERVDHRPVVVAEGVCHAHGCTKGPATGGESMTYLGALQRGAVLCPVCGGR